MVTIKAVTVRGRMREEAKGSRGSDPRLLGLTMGWLLDHTFFGERPRASRIVQALGLDQPSLTFASARWYWDQID